MERNESKKPRKGNPSQPKGPESNESLLARVPKLYAKAKSKTPTREGIGRIELRALLAKLGPFVRGGGKAAYESESRRHSERATRIKGVMDAHWAAHIELHRFYGERVESPCVECRSKKEEVREHWEVGRHIDGLWVGMAVRKIYGKQAVRKADKAPATRGGLVKDVQKRTGLTRRELALLVLALRCETSPVTNWAKHRDQIESTLHTAKRDLRKRRKKEGGR